jgi:hypothetical protein
MGAQEPPGDPLFHVVGAEVNPEIALGWWKGIRAPGIFAPMSIAKGSQHARRKFRQER